MTYSLIKTGPLASVMLPTGPLVLHTVLGIGRNYADHAKEQGAAVPEAPMVFTKNAASVVLSEEAIVIPPVCAAPGPNGGQVDFEGELAVVIGGSDCGPCKDVSVAEAGRHILGYCCGNDVSARWWQKSGSGGQFFRGKSFDTFCPLGPWVTPAAAVDAVGGANSLRLITRVNGEVMQDDSVGKMIFGVAELVSELSRGMTLLPGTVILTGTPAGVGMARTPPRWLKGGDVVEIEIGAGAVSLGVLRNVVRGG
jgi:2-keto-4-pentenoate hydratase/2-oxohepta-3-ene-1,7-dioic acid hydratase in catechol pathway